MSTFKQDFPSQDLPNSIQLNNLSPSVPQAEFGQSNIQSLKRYFDETRGKDNRFLTNFAISDSFVNKYNVGEGLDNVLLKQADGRTDGGIRQTLNQFADSITTSPVELAASSGNSITIIHNRIPDFDNANLRNFQEIRKQAISGELAAYDLNKSALVGNVLLHTKMASADSTLEDGRKIRDLYLDTQMYGSQTLNIPGFDTFAINQQYQDIYFRPKILKGSIEDKATQREIDYLVNAPVDKSGFKQLDPMHPSLNYEAGFILSGTAIMEKFSEELSIDPTSISDVIMVSPSADFSEAKKVYAGTNLDSDLTVHDRLKYVGEQLTTLSSGKTQVYRGTSEGRMGPEIKAQALRYGMNIGTNQDPNKPFNPNAPHENIYSIIRKDNEGNIRPDSLLIVSTRRQSDSTTIEKGYAIRYGDAQKFYDEKVEKAKTDPKLKQDLYKQFNVNNDKDLSSKIEGISRGLNSQEMMSAILQEVNYEYIFSKDTYAGRALASSRIIKDFKFIYGQGAATTSITKDILVNQPLKLDQSIFDTYITTGKLPKTTPLSTLYEAYTGEAAPTAVIEADKQITTPSLGTQINYQLGFDFYKPGLGIIGSTGRLIGKGLDTLTGYHAYQREQAIIKHQQDDIKDLENNRSSTYKAGPLEGTISLGIESIKGMTLSVLEYGALLGSTFFIKELAEYGQQNLRANTEIEGTVNTSGIKALKIQDKVVNTYRAFGARVQEGLLQGFLDLITPDIAYKDQKLYNVIKARQKVILHGAYVLDKDGTTKIQSKQTKEYIAAVKEYNIQLNQFDSGALEDLPNYNPMYEKLNRGLIGEEWAAEAERRIVVEGEGALEPVQGLLPAIREPMKTTNTLILNETVGTDRIRKIAKHIDLLTETVSIPGLNWLIKPDYNPAQVKYLEDSSLSHVYGTTILSRSIANIALATRTIADIAKNPFEHLENVQSLYEQSNKLDTKYKKLLEEVATSDIDNIDDGLINKVYNFSEESREFQRTAADNNFFHLGNDADKVLYRQHSMVSLPVKTLAIGAGLFATDFLLDQFILRTQGVTLAKQVALFKEVRKEEGQVFNFEFNSTAGTSVMLGAGIIGGATVATILPTIRREHIGKIYYDGQFDNAGQLAEEVEAIKVNLNNKIQNNLVEAGIDTVQDTINAADNLRLTKIDRLIETTEGLRNLQKYKFEISPTRFLIGAAVGMMVTKLAYTMAAGALNFTYSEGVGTASSTDSITADKLTLGLENLLKENTLLEAIISGRISETDTLNIRKDSRSPLYQRAVKVLGKAKVDKIFEEYKPTMERVGTIKFASRALYAEAEMVDALIKKYRSPIETKRGQYNYAFAFQSTAGFVQFATVTRTNPITDSTSVNFGIQILPTLGIGASPILPFGIKTDINARSRLLELQKEWSKDKAKRQVDGIGSLYQFGQIILDNTLGAVSYEERNILTPGLMFLGSTSLIATMYSKSIAKDVITKKVDDSTYKPFIKAAQAIAKLPRSLTSGILALTYATVSTLNSAVIASLDYLESSHGTQIYSRNYKLINKAAIPFLVFGAAYALTSPFDGVDTAVSNKREESGAVFLDPFNRASAVIALGAGTLKLSTDLGIIGTNYNADLRRLPIIGTQIGVQQDIINRELVNTVNPATAELVESTNKTVLKGAHYPNIIKVARAKTELAALGLFTVILTSKLLARAIGNIGGAEALEQVYNTPFASILRVLSGVEESEFQSDITTSKSKFNRRKAEYKQPNDSFITSAIYTLSEVIQTATLGFIDIKKVSGFYKDTPNLFIPAFGPTGYSFNEDTRDFKTYNQLNESGQFDLTFAASTMMKSGLNMRSYETAINFLDLDISKIEAGNFRLVTKLSKYLNTRVDRMKIQGLFTSYELDSLQGKTTLAKAFAIRLHKATNISYMRPSEILNNLIESSYRAGSLEGTFTKPRELLYDVFDTMDILNLPIFSRNYKNEFGKTNATSKIPVDIQSLIYGYVDLGNKKESSNTTPYIPSLMVGPNSMPVVLTRILKEQFQNAPALTWMVFAPASLVSSIMLLSVIAVHGIELVEGLERKFGVSMAVELAVDENLRAYKEAEQMVNTYKVIRHGDFVLTTGAKSPARTIVLTDNLIKEYFEQGGTNNSQYKDIEAAKKSLKIRLSTSIAEIQTLFKDRTKEVLGISKYLKTGKQTDIEPLYYLKGTTTIENIDNINILRRASASSTMSIMDDILIISPDIKTKGFKVEGINKKAAVAIKSQISIDLGNKLKGIFDTQITKSTTVGNLLFGKDYDIAEIVDVKYYNTIVDNYLYELQVRYTAMLKDGGGKVNASELNLTLHKLNAEFSKQLSIVEKDIIKHKVFSKIGVELPTTPAMGSLDQLDNLAKYYKFSQSRQSINLVEDTLGAAGTFAGTYLTRYRFTYGVLESLSYLYSSDDFNKRRAAESFVTNLTYEILGIIGAKIGIASAPALTNLTGNANLSNLLGASAGIALIVGIEVFRNSNFNGSRRIIKELERKSLDMASKGVLVTTGLTKSILPFSEQIGDILVGSIFHPLGMKIQQKALKAYMSGNASGMIWNLLLPESMYKQLAEPVILQYNYGEYKFQDVLMKANPLQRDIYYRRKFYQEGVLRYGEPIKITSIHKNLLGQSSSLVDARNEARYGKYLPKYNLSTGMRLTLERREYYSRYFQYGAGTHKFRKSGENQIAGIVNKGYSISYIAGVRANASFLTNLMLELDDFNNYFNKDIATLHKQFTNSTRLRTVLAEAKIYASKVKNTLLNAKGIDIIGVNLGKEVVEDAVEGATKEAIIKPKFVFGLSGNIASNIKTGVNQIIDGFTSPISKIFSNVNSRLFAVVNDLSRGIAYIGIGIIQLLKTSIKAFDDIAVYGMSFAQGETSSVRQSMTLRGKATKVIEDAPSTNFIKFMKSTSDPILATTKLLAKLTPSFLAIGDVLYYQDKLNSYDFGFSFVHNPKLRRGKVMPEGFDVKDTFRSLTTSGMSMIVGGFMQFMGFGFISTLITTIAVSSLFGNPIADFYADKSLRERENHSGFLLGLNALGALLQVITNLRDVSMPRLVGVNLAVKDGKVVDNEKLRKQTQNRADNAFGIRKHIALYELEMIEARKLRVDANSIGHFDSTFSYIQINKNQVITKGQEVANSLYGKTRLSEKDTRSILSQIDAQAKRAAMDAFKKSNGEMSNLDYRQLYYTEVFIRLNAVSNLNPKLRNIVGTKAPSIIKNIVRTLEDTSIMVSREGVVLKPNKEKGKGKRFFGFHYSFALHDTIMNQIEAERNKKDKPSGAASEVKETLDSNNKAPLATEIEEEVTIRTKGLNRPTGPLDPKDLTTFFTQFKNILPEYHTAANKHYSRVDPNHVRKVFKRATGNIPILIIDTETISTIKGDVVTPGQPIGKHKGALISQYASLEMNIDENLQAQDIQNAQLTELTIKTYWSSNTRQEFLNTQQAIDKLGPTNANVGQFVWKLNADLKKVYSGDVILVGHNIKAFDLVAMDETLEHIEKTSTRLKEDPGFIKLVQQTRVMLKEIMNPPADSKIVVVDTLNVSAASTASIGAVRSTDKTEANIPSKVPINVKTTVITKGPKKESSTNSLKTKVSTQAPEENIATKIRSPIEKSDNIADPHSTVKSDNIANTNDVSEIVVRRRRSDNKTSKRRQAEINEQAKAQQIAQESNRLINKRLGNAPDEGYPTVNTSPEGFDTTFNINTNVPITEKFVKVTVEGINPIVMTERMYKRIEQSIHSDMIMDNYRGQIAFQQLFIKHYYIETKQVLVSSRKIVNRGLDSGIINRNSMVIQHSLIQNNKAIVIDLSNIPAGNQNIINDIEDIKRKKVTMWYTPEKQAQEIADVIRSIGIDINKPQPVYIYPTLSAIEVSGNDIELLDTIKTKVEQKVEVTKQYYITGTTYRLLDESLQPDVNKTADSVLENLNTQKQLTIEVEDRDGKKHSVVVTKEQLKKINTELEIETLGHRSDSYLRQAQLREIYTREVDPTFSPASPTSTKRLSFIKRFMQPRSELIARIIVDPYTSQSRTVMLTASQDKKLAKAIKQITKNAYEEDITLEMRKRIVVEYELITTENFSRNTASYRSIPVTETSIITPTSASSTPPSFPNKGSIIDTIEWHVGGRVYTRRVTITQKAEIEKHLIDKIAACPNFDKLTEIEQKELTERFKIEVFNIVVHGRPGTAADTYNYTYTTTDTITKTEVQEVKQDIRLLDTAQNEVAEVIDKKSIIEDKTSIPETPKEENVIKTPELPVVPPTINENESSTKNKGKKQFITPSLDTSPSGGSGGGGNIPPKTTVLPNPEDDNNKNKVETETIKVVSSSQEATLELTTNSNRESSQEARTKADRTLSTTVKTIYGNQIKTPESTEIDTVEGSTPKPKYTTLSEQVIHLLEKAHTAGFDVIRTYIALPGFFTHGGEDLLREPDRVEKIESVSKGTKTSVDIDRSTNIVDKGFHTLDVADTAASVYLIARGAWNLGRYLYITLFEKDKKSKESARVFRALSNHETSLFQGFMFSSTLAALGSSKLTIGTGLILGHIAGRLGIDVSLGLYSDYSKQLAEREQLGLHTINYGAYNPGTGYLSLTDNFNSFRTGQLGKTLSAFIELRVSLFSRLNNVVRVGARGLAAGTFSYLLLEKLVPNYNKTNPTLNTPLLIDAGGIKVTQNQFLAGAVAGLFASNKLRKLSLGSITSILGLTTLMSVLYENYIDSPDNKINDRNNLKFMGAASIVSALLMKAPLIKTRLSFKAGVLGIATWATFSYLTKKGNDIQQQGFLQKQGAIVTTSATAMLAYSGFHMTNKIPKLQALVKVVGSTIKYGALLGAYGLASVFLLDQLKKTLPESMQPKRKLWTYGVFALGASVPILSGLTAKIGTSKVRYGTRLITSIKRLSFKRISPTISKITRSSTIKSTTHAKLYAGILVGGLLGVAATQSYISFTQSKSKTKNEQLRARGFVGGAVLLGSAYAARTMMPAGLLEKLNIVKERTASVFSSASGRLNRIAAASRLAQGKITKGLIFGGILYAAFGSSFQKPKDYGGIKLNAIQNQALGLGINAIAGEAIAFGAFPILKAMKYSTLARAGGVGVAIGVLNYFNRTSANKKDSTLMRVSLSAISGATAAYLTSSKVQRAIASMIKDDTIFGLTKVGIAKAVKRTGYIGIGVLAGLALLPAIGHVSSELFNPETPTNRRFKNITLLGGISILGAAEYSSYKGALRHAAYKNVKVPYEVSKGHKIGYAIGLGFLATALTFQLLEKNKKVSENKKALIATGVGVGTTAAATYFQYSKPVLNKWIGRAGLAVAVGALTYSQLSEDMSKKNRLLASGTTAGLVSLLGFEKVRAGLSKIVEPAAQILNLALVGYNAFAFIQDSKIAGLQDQYRAQRKQQRNEAAGSLGFSAADVMTNAATMWASGSVFNMSLGLSGVFTGLAISLMTNAINSRNTKDIMNIQYRLGTQADIKKAAEMDTQRSALQGAANSFRGSGIALYGIRGKSGLFMASNIDVIKGTRKLGALSKSIDELSSSIREALTKITSTSIPLDELDEALNLLINKVPNSTVVRALKGSLPKSGKSTIIKTTNFALEKAKEILIPGVKGTQASSSIVNTSATTLATKIEEVNNALNSAKSALENARAASDATAITKQTKIVESLEKTLIKASKYQAQIASTAGETAEEASKSLKLVKALKNPVIKTGLQYIGGVLNLAVGGYDIARAGQGIQTLKEGAQKGRAGQQRVKDYQAVYGLGAQGIARAAIGLGALILTATAVATVTAASLPALAVVGLSIAAGLAVVAAQEAFIQYVADPFGRGLGAYKFNKTRQKRANDPSYSDTYHTKLDGATGLGWFDKKIRQFADVTVGQLGYQTGRFIDWVGNLWNQDQSSIPGAGVSKTAAMAPKSRKGRNNLRGKEVVIAAGFDDMGMIKTTDFEPENGVSKFFKGITKRIKNLFEDQTVMHPQTTTASQQFLADGYTGYSFLNPYGLEGTREKRDRVAYNEYLTSGSGNTKKGNIFQRFFGWVADGTKANIGRAMTVAGNIWKGARSVGASVVQGINSVFNSAKNAIAGAASAIAGLYGVSGTVIGSWDIAGLPGIKQYVSRLQQEAPQYFNNTLEGYAATVMAVQIMMQEFPSLGRNSQSDPNIFFTAMGGRGSTMRGAAQFDTSSGGGWGPKTDTPKKYAETLGGLLHNSTRGAESAPYTTGMTPVQSFLRSYNAGTLTTSQQLNDQMRSWGMGGGEKVGGYFRNSWHGLTTVNFPNMSQLDPLLNFQVITSGVGQVAFGTAYRGLTGQVFAPNPAFDMSSQHGWGGRRGGGRIHYKIDYFAAQGARPGQEIVAPIDGVYTVYGEQNGEYMSKVTNGNVEIILGHVKNPIVGLNKSTPVSAGQRVATIGGDRGSWGSSGLHLDYGITIGGKPIRPSLFHADPYKYLGPGYKAGGTTNSSTTSNLNTATFSAAHTTFINNFYKNYSLTPSTFIARGYKWEGSPIGPLMTLSQYKAQANEKSKLKSTNTFGGDPNYLLNVEALKALDALIADVSANTGQELIIASGYRSIEMQAAMWENKLTKDKLSPSEIAKTLAPPGMSEHQTGLAVDFVLAGVTNFNNPAFKKTLAYKRLVAIAAKYGYVQSFTGTTGGAGEESWHWKYEGVKSSSTYNPDTTVATNITPSKAQTEIQAKAAVVYGLDKDINIVAYGLTQQEARNNSVVAQKAPINASENKPPTATPKVTIIDNPVNTSQVGLIPSKEVTVAVTQPDGSTQTSKVKPKDVSYTEFEIYSTTIFNPDYMGLDPTLDAMILSGNIFAYG